MYTSVSITAVLLFDGEPQVSEGLRAWLSPFLLEGGGIEDAEETGLGRPGLPLFLDESNAHIDVDALEEGLLFEAGRLGLHMDSVEDYTELLRLIGQARGRQDLITELLPAPVFLQQPGCIEAATFTLVNALRLALALSEGHNANGVAMMSTIQSDRQFLWSAEGGASVSWIQPDGAVRTAGFSSMHLLQLALGKPQDMGAWFAETVNAAVPPDKRADLRDAFLSALAVEDAQEQSHNAVHRPRDN